MSRALLKALRTRDAKERWIRTGVVGAGDFGTDIVAQMAQAPGMIAAVVADLDLDAAVNALCAAGHSRDDVVRTENISRAADAILAGRPVATTDGAALAGLPLDAVVDSTGVPDAGATIASECLRAGRHVVMVNVEADIVVGSILRTIADAENVVYTLADGDQPSLICALADFATAIGLQVLSGGKGTRMYPVDHPRRVAGERGDDGRRTTIMYYEGTKSQIEMAAAANVLGWGIDVRGLHGPSLALEDMPTVFGPRESGGLLARTPVVDYVNCVTSDGEPTGNPVVQGVWVVVTSANPVALKSLARKGVPMSSDGTRGLLWRPFHLVGLETLYSVAQAVIFGAGTASPLPRPTVEVVAVAKRDLVAGTILDGMGDGQVRGTAEMAEIAAAQRLLPVGLANGVRVRRSLYAGDLITFDDLAAPGDTACWRLRRGAGLLPC